MRRVISAIIALSFAASGSALAADGAAVYAGKCAPCHGPKGEGSPTGPPQKGNPFLKGDAAEIKKVILGGRAGALKKYPNIPVDMPAGLVSEAEADAVLKYLTTDLQK
jgi:mono/diheme cytochrome c family protein